MSGFNDLGYASKFRDLIYNMAKTVVDKERPDLRIGKVYSYNSGTGYIMVLFAGETIGSLVKVKVAKNMQPATTMDLTFGTLGYDAPADIVRVAGRPGNFFVLDYFSGAPVSETGIPTGAPMEWYNGVPPQGWLLQDGTIYNISLYPNLFAVIQNNFGGDGVTTFAVPNRTATSPAVSWIIKT